MTVYIYRDVKRERKRYMHTCTAIGSLFKNHMALVFLNIYLLSFQKKCLFWARGMMLIIILCHMLILFVSPGGLSQVILTVKWH